MQLSGLILPALLIGADPDGAEPVSLRLEKGQELVWRGTFEEETILPGARGGRSYEWEGRALVLDRGPDGARVALLATLRLRPDPKAKGPGPAPAAHVELVRVGKNGRVELLPGASLLDPAQKAGPRSVPPPALDALPLREAGMFLEVPGGRVAEGRTWDVAEKGRPFRAWTVEGAEPLNGARCFKVVGTQQTAGWAVPRGGEAAWRRVDTVWLSPVGGHATRVERLIERRDPETQEVVLRTKLAYEQVRRRHLPPSQLEDEFAEAAQALHCAAALDALARDPARAGTQVFEAILRRIAAHEAQRPVGESSPYREALHAVRRRADAARRGNLPPLAEAGEEAAEPAGKLTAERPAPDFVAARLNGEGDLRLYRQLGRPVILFYYQPDGESAETLLRFAERLHADPQRRTAVLAVAVGDDAAARRQAKAMSLTVPVLSGRDVKQLHAIESTPQAVVLDHEGAVRRVFLGWGEESGPAVWREALKWARP